MTTMTFRNPIVNSDMGQTQRGTSFSDLASGSYSLDRWKYEKRGNMVLDLSQSEEVPDQKLAASLRMDVTTADPMPGSEDCCTILQPVEGFDFCRFREEDAVLSFWAKSTYPGIMGVSFRNGNRDNSWLDAVNVERGWRRLEVPVTFNAGGEWDYEDGIGVNVAFCLAAGTSLKSNAGTWLSGNYLTRSDQTNFVTDVETVMWLTGIQLDYGTEPADYQLEGHTDLLSSCHRYYWRKVFGDGDVIGVGRIAAPNTIRVVVPFPHLMRAGGEVTYSATSSFRLIDSADVEHVCDEITVQNVSAYDAVIDFKTVESGSWGVGSMGEVRCVRGGSWIAIDAEL